MNKDEVVKQSRILNPPKDKTDIINIQKYLVK